MGDDLAIASDKEVGRVTGCGVEERGGTEGERPGG